MPDNQDPYRRNDNKALTPLLVMALIIVVGIAYFAFVGAAPSAGG